MRGRAGWLALALLAYVVWLLVKLPLQPLLGLAQESAPLPVQLHGVSGGPWSGRAQRVRVAGLSLDNLEWRFAPMGLLRGRLVYAVSFRDDDGAAIAELVWSPWGRMELASLSGKLEARRLAPLLAQALPLELDGALVFDEAGLTLVDGGPAAAQGQVRWLAARVVAPLAIDLGQVELQLESADEGIAGHYQGQGDALSMRGSAQWHGDGRYHAEIFITPRSAELADLFSTTGQRTAQGAYRFVQEGQW